MKKQKYYVVWVGNQPGVYDNWPECEKQVKGIMGAKYKSFKSLAEAKIALGHNYQDYYQKSKTKVRTLATLPLEVLEKNSISVDAACSGNPGSMEYQGVETNTGKVVFHYGPVYGTNNLGEFLAIVHILAHLKEAKDDMRVIYSDSAVAIKWIKTKQVKSKLIKNEQTKKVWELVARALVWLNNNTYANKILKWETDKWGEIRADFGRK
jgi:ribonuclease HI